MRGHLSKGAYLTGVVTAIERIGEKLKEFFPYEENDIDELPDDISIGE